MQELTKALEKVARKIIWRDSSKSKHTSNDLKRIYDCRQFEGNAWFLLASYKARNLSGRDCRVGGQTSSGVDPVH